MATWTISQDGVTLGSLALSDANTALVAEYVVGTQRGSVLVSAEVPEVPSVDAAFDANGNVVTPAKAMIPGAPAVYRDPTPSEAIAKLAGQFFDSLLSQATQFHKDAAAQAAAAAVAPITPS